MTFSSCAISVAIAENIPSCLQILVAVCTVSVHSNIRLLPAYLFGDCSGSMQCKCT